MIESPVITGTVLYHTDTKMNGNACLLLIKARQTDGTCWVAPQNQICHRHSQSLYSIHTVVQMLPLKKKKTKQKSETVLAENVCKPLRAEEEGGWCLKEQVNATTYVKVKKMSVFKLMLKNH